ncbi:serine hydrolase domain-containing protein [Spirosoma sp. SC4-14]|uniref:serine hydrolase domain-containing protein n=1 Tax=Spirosoma sp. SC4-14 TaxID=3128900 RepID=UPI0030CFAEBF
MKKLLVVLSLLSSICNAQTIDQKKALFVDKKYSAKIAIAQKLVDSLMREKSIPGLSVCVSTKDKILWAQGFGYADMENKVPVTLQSKFRIGSISKTLTALALGKLIEENAINLSDPVQKYVPYFPEKKYPVTIYQLASHTAGIRDYNYRNGEYVSDKNYGSVKDAISIFKDDTLLFQPGTKYSYSTYGYVLLSAVIEGAAHKDFLPYMHDSVFIPIGLQNTVPDFNDSIVAHRVSFYDESNGKIVNGYHVNNSNKWAGGGFISTPTDLVRMSQSLLKHQFISEQTLQKFWNNDTLQNGEKIAYGIGWKLDKDNMQRKFVYHGGSSIGGRSFLLVYPKEQLIIAITCNLSTNFDQRFILKLTDLFL